MFFRLHFKCRFWQCCLDFWRQFGAPFGIIFQKKTLPKMASKKKTPHIKTPPYEHVRRLPGRPPRVRASQTRNKSSSRSSRNCCSNSFSFVSFLFLFWKCCFSSFSFQICWKLVQKNGNCQEHIVNYLTRPRPRPGEFIPRYLTNILVEHILQKISMVEHLEIWIMTQATGWCSTRFLLPARAPASCIYREQHAW